MFLSGRLFCFVLFFGGAFCGGTGSSVVGEELAWRKARRGGLSGEVFLEIFVVCITFRRW